MSNLDFFHWTTLNAGMINEYFKKFIFLIVDTQMIASEIYLMSARSWQVSDFSKSKNCHKIYRKIWNLILKNRKKLKNMTEMSYSDSKCGCLRPRGESMASRTEKEYWKRRIKCFSNFDPLIKMRFEKMQKITTSSVEVYWIRRRRVRLRDCEFCRRKKMLAP